jgi:Zn-dependent protease/predicted transcriptional regulator
MSIARIRRMGATVRLFKIGRIPIFVHASWLVVYALITWTLAVGYFPHVLPDLDRAQYWLHGLIAGLLLFASVLLHELAHSLVATAHGLTVRGITLHVFGGVSHLEDEAPTPRSEVLIAAAGPLASFAIAGALWGLKAAGLAAGGSVGAIASYLMTVNVMVGVFNLIPGFPLDGGRLLRAALWGWHGSLTRATYLASRAGVAFAFALMAWGVVQILTGSVVSGMWLVLIGLFLQNAANASYAQIGLRESLGRLSVRQIMAANVIAVGPDDTVASLVDRFWDHHVASFPVVDGGRVLGIASIGDLQRVARDQWPVLHVRDVMRPLDETLTVGPTDTVLRALERASENGVGRLAVMEGDRLVGYLSTQDITHVLALHGLGRDAVDGADVTRRRPDLRRAA